MPKDLRLSELPTDSARRNAVKDHRRHDRARHHGPLEAESVPPGVAAGPAGTSGGLQALVPPGMRAVTIEVNNVTSMSGLLVPGARVDVVATLRNATGRASSASWRRTSG